VVSKLLNFPFRLFQPYGDLCVQSMLPVFYTKHVTVSKLWTLSGLVKNVALIPCDDRFCLWQLSSRIILEESKAKGLMSLVLR